ncbi:MAG: GNAT family N-acetyltransferase [Pirellulaceae bacterium]
MESELNTLGQPVGLPAAHWQLPMTPSQDTMEGRFCRVEALSAERHARDLHAANSLDTENRNWTYMTYGPFAGFAEYRNWVSASAASSDPLFFAILDKSSERAVGVASYLRIDPRHGSIEVGHLQFSPLMQGKPAATEAMFLLMQRAFELGYRRYEWKCNALNEPSRRAAQRLGLSFEGVFRQAAVVKGRNRDTAWYAAIDQEWPALKAAFQRWLEPSNFDESGRQRVALSVLTAPLLKQRG